MKNKDQNKFPKDFFFFDFPKLEKQNKEEFLAQKLLSKPY